MRSFFVCLAVKTNQPILYEEIKDYFSYAEKEEPEQVGIYQTIEKNHGRIEKRKKQCKIWH